MAQRIRTAVVGCGYFGSFHARHHAAADRAELVALVDGDMERASARAAEYGATAYGDHRELIGKVEAASVAVPAPFLFPVARDLLEAGIHVLVEKPMTETLDQAAELIEVAKASGALLQVGLIENFSSVYKALEARIESPLYIEAHRIAQWKTRATEIDVILDLMIHDIDVILGLVPSHVVSLHAIGAPVLAHSEDIVNARLQFENGCVASVVASRVSTKAERKMRIFQPDRYVVCDFGQGSLFQVERVGDPDTDGLAALKPDFREIAKEDALGNEIAEFLDCVASGRHPRVDGARGREALRVALMVKDSVREHRRFIEARSLEGKGPLPRSRAS